MKKRETAEIIIETDEIWAIDLAAAAVLYWCRKCGAEVEMIVPEAASVESGLSVRVINRRVETGRLHFTETASGWLLICRLSLLSVMGRLNECKSKTFSRKGAK